MQEIRLPQVVPNIRQAMVWVADSWDVIKPSAIQNCWRKSGIIPSDWAIGRSRQTSSGVTPPELQSFIDQLPLGNDALDAEAYQDFPHENEVEF